MNDKKIPSPPVLPPKIKIKENFCLFHKGEIEGETYTCPKCGTKYCLKCAKKARSEAKLCVKCKQLVMM
ncbi:MAG: hypothetical protein GF317_10165 [Candidatus Lokiarchaeota archaeon]|nr:hypothetical protein [Candidatus Lokiarchaeota archaeon]MBD3200024.1 hypothetical protein [Candidatus Lokiarchaeota archaeon]